MNLDDEIQLNLTRFQSLTHFVLQTMKYRKDMSCHSKQLLWLHTTIPRKHPSMLIRWPIRLHYSHPHVYSPQWPGRHAAFHALASVCSSTIWSKLYTMWLLDVHLHEGIPEGPQIHMKQRCLCCSHAVDPARTQGVLFREDRSAGMSILCREKSLNGFHLEQASYTVMQEERSIFLKVILTVTIRKKSSYEHVPNSEWFLRYSCIIKSVSLYMPPV